MLAGWAEHRALRAVTLKSTFAAGFSPVILADRIVVDNEGAGWHIIG